MSQSFNPFDAVRQMGEAWSKNVQSFVQAQQGMLGTMMPGLPATGMTVGMPDAQAMQVAQETFVQAWSSAQTISSTFADSLKGRSAKTDPVAADVLAKVFDPRGWLAATSEVDEALNRMAEGPRLADLWTIERKFTALFTAWLGLRRRNLEHSTVMLEAWQKAAAAFAKAVNERAGTDEPFDSASEMMALWVETANDVLLETQRSEPFLKSQRETLKASTDLRLAQQEVTEFYSQMFGYPTRAEIDDVHRSLTELRREVRVARRGKGGRRAAGAKAKSKPEGGEEA